MVNPNKFDRPEGFSKTLRVYPAARIGQTAREILRTSDFPGTVLAVVTNAVYLTTRNDEEFWLAQTHVPAHTRAILASFDSSIMRVGMDTNVTDGHLTIGDVAIDWRGADEWQPGTITQLASIEIIRSRASEVRSVIARSGVCDEAISKLLVGDCFTQTARTDKNLRNLIGLGAGLTPAGDDFAGGLLFAAHHFPKIYSEIFYWDHQAIRELIEYARTQTNKISFTILHDLARGQGPEPLHDFIVTLLSEEKPNDLQSSVIHVLAIGHSTGHAMLDGVLTGIELMMNGRSN